MTDALPAAHVHAEPAGAALAQAARAVLERAGEQWTGLRATVFDVLAVSEGPASAYDIAEGASARLGRRVAPNSIYRILDLFVATNLATRVESLNAYLATAHPGCVHDCIFLLCDRCGATDHIDDDALSDALRSRVAAARFTPSRPVIEVHGRCARCA